MFSQANNNPNCLLGQPDAQTGTFSFLQDFGKLQANSGFGPECDLQMNFSILSTLDSSNGYGVGRGFSLKLGGFNQAASTVTLNSGESYKVFAQGGGNWSLSHKAQDIVIQGNDSYGAYIYHKNGDYEVLRSDTGDNSNMYLSKYVSADGRYLEFVNSWYNGIYRLTEVKDNENTSLATIEYVDDNQTTVTVYPTSASEKRVYNLYFDAEKLLYLMEQPNSQQINITYEEYTDPKSQNKLWLIQKIEYPTGATEEAYYFNKMQLPPNNNINEMPALSTHIKTIASDQPVNAIQTDFTYDEDLNYWGLNSGVDWRDNYDGLFDCGFAYRYSSTTTCGDRKTITTYNKFHQTVQKVETNGDDGKVKTTTYQYFCDEEKVLDEQETRYELEKSKSMEIKDSSGSRVLTEESDYDVWGNVLTHTLPNGTSTVTEYYPPEGAEGCPANPYGLAAFKKSETLKPNDGSEGKTKTFTYKLIKAVDNNETRCIVSNRKSYNGNTFVSNHFDSSNPKLQCLVSDYKITIGEKEFSKRFDISFEGESYTAKETLTAFDSTTSSTSKTMSKFSGNPLQEVDRSGVITKYTYDGLGRVSTTTSRASTKFESTTTYSYTLKPNGKIGTLVSHQTSTGLAQDVYYDADQKELSVHIEDQYGIKRKTSQTSYDNQGRIATETSFDYEISDDGQSATQTYTDTVTKTYDSWGEVKEQKFNDGATGTEVIRFDPVNLSRSTQLYSGGSPVVGATKVTYNLFGDEEKTELFSLSGGVYSTTKYTFNGFGLRASITTPMSATASINKYDSFDRPVEFRHFDESVVLIEYPAFTTKRLMASMKLSSTGFVIGQHEYDGLLRVTSRTVNGNTRKFSYEGANHKPSRLVNGQGQTILFSYNPELGLQTAKKACFTSEVSIGDWGNASKVSEETFTFGKPSTSNEFLGRIVSALSQNGNNHTIEYTDKGMVKKATQTVEAHAKTYVVNKFTTSGKPLKFSFDGREMSVSYDQYGRLSGSTDGEISTETAYDGADRVIKETVKKNGSEVRTTDITYDEYSRESQYTIKCGGKTITITQEYDAEDKVTKKHTAVDSNKLMEEFEYDAKRRLTKYKATTDVASMLPCDEFGHSFCSQSFSFDELDNKKEIVTEFPNNQSDTASFTYDSTKNFQLNEIKHSLTDGDNAYPATISFTYDADGNILTMGGNSMTYSVSGRMSSKNGVSYSYDPFDRLVKSGETIHFYSGPRVIQEVNGSSTTSFVRHGKNTVAQRSDGIIKILGSNHQSSIVCAADGSSVATTTYGPFGTARDIGARAGFNGELKDNSDPNIYPLGNGTRLFFPSMGRFSSSDTYSPFNSSGEINPYAYCNGDPVNASDPSGHSFLANLGSMICGILGLIGAVFTGGSSLVVAAGVVGGLAAVSSAALGFAADAVDDAEVSDKLGKASFGLGIIGMVLSLGATAASVGKVMKVRSIVKSGSKTEDFYKLLNADGAIKFETQHSIRFSKFRPKSSKYSLNEAHSLRRVKVTPEGVFAYDEIPVVKKRFFTKTTQSPITRDILFKAPGKMRSLHSTLKKTGSYATMWAFTWQNIPLTTLSIVSFAKSAAATSSSEPGVEESVISSTGIPTNPQSFAYDADSEDED